MSGKEKHVRCIKCIELIWRTSGRSKLINTQLEADKAANVLQKEVVVGSTLCNKCRSILYTKKDEKPAAPEEERTDDNQSSQPSTQSSESSFLQSSGTSSIGDPSYVLKETPKEEPETYIEMPFSRVVSTHKYCFLCGLAKKIITVPFQARQQIFTKKLIFVPKGNRCCSDHLIKNRLFEEDLQSLRVCSNTSMIEINDLQRFMECLAIQSEYSITDKIGDYSLSEERLRVFTRLNWENMIELREMMTSMRNTLNRNVNQALVVFLFKLRTGNSNSVIASLLGLEREQQVSEYCDAVIKSFEKDVLPLHFGFKAKTREQLINEETSNVAKKLYNLKDDQLVLIFDGTYVHHQKSSNNEYQRSSSGQKKKPLCKPFTICTTNGHVVETLGPFSANLNDAKIMEEILNEPNGLSSILKKGDICVVDRGFRDVRDILIQRGYIVLMPALKGKRKQLPTIESNESREVTEVRWIVEAVHGIIGQKFKLLHHQVDNKLLPKIQSYCRIASFLYNKFCKRLESDVGLCDQILARMKSKKSEENTLAKEIEEKHWGRRKTPFRPLLATDVSDFPEMTENDLKIFFTGSYQLSQAVSYLAERMDDDNNINVSCVKERENILKIEVKSRHINKKTYKCFIDYVPNSIGCSGIRRHFCDCANGSRTVGCCSHLAAIIYYLAHARYLSKIVRPAEILSKLFIADQVTPVINEDSDED